MASSHSPDLHIRKVAVIGAGVSGVSTAIHLKRAGLDTTVFERTSRAGGIWVYDERTPKDPAYPSTLPSVGESPEYEEVVPQRQKRHDSPLHDNEANNNIDDEDVRLAFAPPGPAYIALKNNVSTIEMELSTQSWKPGTEEFVKHNVLAEYIHDAAVANGVLDAISFNTRVNNVRKEGAQWRVDTAQLVDDGFSIRTDDNSQLFDAVVVASGHYHACNVPDIPGLAQWKQRFPNRVRHSKLYRRPDEFKDQNVLLIGAGVSSTDIARDLGLYARSIFQSSRGGPYDLPSHILPDNAARIGGIVGFDSLSADDLTSGGALPGTITLRSGQKLCEIHQVIVCTGYHCSLPFMKQFHADGVRAADADENVLVTDGQQVHNLHKDIFYIQDPSLAFIGVPYHTATFTLFEFQAQALAAVYGGKVLLPDQQAMGREYQDRIQRKGAGRTFHSLKWKGEEIAYVQELANMVNAGWPGGMRAHSQRWLDAYARRVERQKALFGTVRDRVFDEQGMELMVGCT